MKTAIRFLLLATFALTLFIGCSNDDEDSQPANVDEIVGSYTGVVTNSIEEGETSGVVLILEKVSDSRISITLPEELLPVQAEGLDISIPCDVTISNGIYSLSGSTTFSYPPLLNNVPITISNSRIDAAGNANINVSANAMLMTVTANFIGVKE